MKEIYVNNDWTFEEAVDNVKTLRTQYEEVLASFSYFDLKKEIEFKKNTRNSIYKLNILEWQKDKLWGYINRFEFYYVLKGIIERKNKNARNNRKND